MSTSARILGWTFLTVLTFITVCLIRYRLDPANLPVSLQRVGAFALFGFILAVGYPRHRWQVLAFTIAAAGVLEAAQMLDPSRHGRIADLAVKVTGGALGVTAAFALSRLPRLPTRARA